MKMTGGQALIEALRREGVRTLATIPFRRELLQWALEGSALTRASESLPLPSIADTILDGVGAADRGE